MECLLCLPIRCFTILKTLFPACPSGGNCYGSESHVWEPWWWISYSFCDKGLPSSTLSTKSCRTILPKVTGNCLLLIYICCVSGLFLRFVLQSGLLVMFKMNMCPCLCRLVSHWSMLIWFWYLFCYLRISTSTQNGDIKTLKCFYQSLIESLRCQQNGSLVFR